MKCEDHINGQFNCSGQRRGIGINREGGGQAAVLIDGKVTSRLLAPPVY